MVTPRSTAVGLSAHRRGQLRILREITEAALAGVDDYRERPTPTELDELQEAGRQTMLAVLSLVQEWDDRRTRRGARLDRTLGDRPDRGEVLGRNARGGKELSDLLMIEKRMVLQIGDALAWITLSGDSHRMAPLFASERAHVPISSGVGLAAVAIIAGALNKSEKVFALENDLTRCLGTADLTVRLADRPGSVPVLMEIKGKGKFGEGSSLGIGVSAATSDSPDDRRLWQLACDVLDEAGIGGGPDDPALVRTGARIARQEAELLKRSKSARDIAARRIRPLGPSPVTLWPALSNVLRSAELRGLAVDLVEPGVVMMAVRISEGEDQRARTASMLIEAEQHFPGISKWTLMSSNRLCMDAPLAPTVAPIPLWRVPRSARTALLTGEMMYVCAVQTDLWERGLSTHGIALEIDKGMWRMRRGEDLRSFSKIEAAKIRFGVAFSGISPREVIGAVARQWGAAIDG